MANRFNPDIHHRRSLRLEGYDYGKAGAYFVTVCSRNRECLFGQVIGSGMRFNEEGECVEACWNDIRPHFRDVELDAFVVMPNHVHGILIFFDFVGAGSPCPSVEREVPAPPFQTPTDHDAESRMGAVTAPLRRTLGRVIAYFKYESTKGINRLRATSGARVWQRNYYEHIIRDEDDMNRIREYILTHPILWDQDDYNPARCEKPSDKI